jgi:hypothetical protein
VACPLDQWKRRQKDHDGDSHADCRVGVVFSRKVRFPDDYAGNNDTHVVQDVAEDMKQHTHHAKLHAVLSRSLHLFVSVIVVVFGSRSNEDICCNSFRVSNRNQWDMARSGNAGCAVVAMRTAMRMTFFLVVRMVVVVVVVAVPMAMIVFCQILVETYQRN